MPVGGWSSGAGAVRLLRSRPVCPRVRSMAGSRTTVLGQGLWRWLALVAVLVGGTLSGCTDGAAQPKPLPSPSSSPSPTASTSSAAAGVSAPTLPAVARGTSAASAKAFARHYVHAFNHASLSGDTSYMRRLSHGDCATCSALATSIDELYGSGGHLEGRGWVVLRAVSIEARGKGRRVRTSIRVEEEKLFESPGAAPDVSEPNHGQLIFDLARRSGGWVVRQLDAVE